ncbi:hypothetical protein [Vibrio variabilis]|uniref:hypothetical protein n=1 Tax=Vibrio variabilis TaxID=990271 RepID=UPI000DD76207|nr:hypothetical protein [Vibrio variabilis]
MESIDKWLEKVYSENDFGRGIATSLSGAVGLASYLYSDDWVIAFFSLVIIFPVARIVATALNERSKVKITNNLQHKQLVDVFQRLSKEELRVIRAFTESGGTALTFRQINELDLSTPAIESLVQRELLWTSVTSDLMTETFALDTDFFDVAKSMAKTSP